MMDKIILQCAVRKEGYFYVFLLVSYFLCLPDGGLGSRFRRGSFYG